jgi:hypothetical protein
MKEANYYTDANNKSEQTINAEVFHQNVLNFLEQQKNEMYFNKFHKDEMTNIQQAIDLIALNLYHVKIINQRAHQEDHK